MSNVFIHPTHIRIEEYTPGSLMSLERELSVWDKVTHSYKFHAFMYDEDSKSLLVPSGINYDLLNPLKAFSQFKDSIYLESDKRKLNRKIKMKYEPRNELQRSAIDFLSKIHADNRLNSQKLLSLGTGEGKTFCAIKHIVDFKHIPIIFVDKENLASQWRDRILEYTDTTEDEIFTISGKQSIDKLMKKTKKDLSKYKFFIAFHKTFQAAISRDPDQIDSIFNKLSISLKIFDEAHLEYENIFRIDMLTNCNSIYLTATPARNSIIEDRVYQSMFYSVDRFSSVEDVVDSTDGENYHRVVICKYNTYPSQEFLLDFAKASSARGFNSNIYSKYLIEHKFEYLYAVIYKVVHDVLLGKGLRKRKILVLAKQKKLVDMIRDNLVSDLSELDITIGRYYSGLSDTERNETMSADIIVTTDASMGTGTDIKGLEAIVSTIPTSSEILTTQMLGRLRRLNNREVFYFDIMDKGFKECTVQLSSRKRKVYDRKAKLIQVVEIKDEQRVSESNI